jgi:uncharacterized protein YcbX
MTYVPYLQTPVTMPRFRGNIVVGGGRKAAWAEDDWYAHSQPHIR